MVATRINRRKLRREGHVLVACTQEVHVVEILSEHAVARDLPWNLVLALAEVHVPAKQVVGRLRRKAHAAHLAALVTVAMKFRKLVPVQLDPGHRRPFGEQVRARQLPIARRGTMGVAISIIVAT